jgi:hypothetical protein
MNGNQPDRQQQEDEQQQWYELGPGSESWKKHREYLNELNEIIQYRKRKKHGYDKV